MHFQILMDFLSLLHDFLTYLLFTIYWIYTIQMCLEYLSFCIVNMSSQGSSAGTLEVKDGSCWRRLVSIHPAFTSINKL